MCFKGDKMQVSDINELTVFLLGDVHYGIPVRQVKEINQNFNITPVPGAPDYVRGAVNLRGQIVTVIDLRMRFGLQSSEITNITRNIVVSFEDEQVGLLVDSVEDITEVDQGRFQPPPANLGGIHRNFFLSAYKREEDLISVLDINEVLQVEES